MKPKNFVSKFMDKSFKNGVEVYRSLKKYQTLKTGLSFLDSFMDGGLNPGDFIELCGMSGMSKTQTCLKIAQNVALKKHYVLYIDTKGDFSAGRVAELLNDEARGDVTAMLLEFIDVVFCYEYYQLINTLYEVKQSMLIGAKKYSLIMIDSLSSLYFPIMGLSSHKGLVFLNIVADLLKELGNTFQLSVIVTNLGTNYNDSESCFDACAGQQDQKLDLRASLGKYWQHVPSIRLVLEGNSDDAATSIYVSKHHSKKYHLKKPFKLN